MLCWAVRMYAEDASVRMSAPCVSVRVITRTDG